MEKVDEGEDVTRVAGLFRTSRCALWKRRSPLLRKLHEKLREGWRAYAAANSGAPAEDDIESARANCVWDEIVDSEELLRMARRLQEMHPEYAADVEALAEEVAGDDKNTVVNVVTEAAADLKAALELVLVPENIARERQTRRQIKNYVFFLRTEAYRRLGSMAEGRVVLDDAERARDAEPLLSWQGQAELLSYAVSVLGNRRTNNGSPEIVDGARACILSMQSTRGREQVRREKRKRPVIDQLKKTRQRINWSTGETELVVFKDILTEVWASGLVRNPQQWADVVWRRECYDLRLYKVGNSELTKAEAFLEWARKHYSLDHCEWKWEKYATPVENGERRVKDPEWKRRRMEELLDARACANDRREAVERTERRPRAARGRWGERY